ncbi:hypothetical protein D3C71_1703040 [compost metagenome]
MIRPPDTHTQLTRAPGINTNSSICIYRYSILTRSTSCSAPLHSEIDFRLWLRPVAQQARPNRIIFSGYGILPRQHGRTVRSQHLSIAHRPGSAIRIGHFCRCHLQRAPGSSRRAHPYRIDNRTSNHTTNSTGSEIENHQRSIDLWRQFALRLVLCK